MNPLKFFPIILLLLLSSCQVQTDNNWISLFNGTDLSGWKVLNGTAEFVVEDGVIVGTSKLGTPNTFLATTVEYSDFILEYEAKLEDGLNSGVQIRSMSLPEYRAGRVHGYQVELDASPRAWTGRIYDEARGGWLYNLEYNPEAKTLYKHNDWNKFRVEAIGSHIRVWLNGEATADLIDDTTPKGFIALQVHSIKDDSSKAGKAVRFRNIRIKTEDLDKAKTPLLNKIPQVSYLINTLTERDIEEGWQLLWDGKTTSGWRGDKPDHFPEKVWMIEDGA